MNEKFALQNILCFLFLFIIISFGYRLITMKLNENNF